ncbi:MAG: ATP synthase F1 subunit epsilon [Planctomycetia bacterium]|jgi:F-type H+-transporting ATPase subunit epsilon|nr:ATP synthase F1 subunit epsilon [Planctomycetia bacterium]MCC7315835.1 ATP synthase F1 subunit epsilon [Planctomycetota bacterium]OQZ04156.1 MAG: ATP synthase F1 subunit epsilon [Planctomycetes bacterium UTPLA1]
MATKGPIECSVITPERQVLSTSANSVVFPAHDGLIGILNGRAPLLCELGTGVLRVYSTEGDMKEVFIDAGFAQVLNNEVTILTERAELAENISQSDANMALSDAEALPAHDEASVVARQKAIARAKTQLSIAKK